MILALQGVIAELKVKGDPRAAEVQCEEEEDDSDMVSVLSADFEHTNITKPFQDVKPIVSIFLLEVLRIKPEILCL